MATISLPEIAVRCPRIGDDVDMTKNRRSSGRETAPPVPGIAAKQRRKTRDIVATSFYSRVFAALILLSAACSSPSAPPQSAAPKNGEETAPALPAKPGDDQPLPDVPSPYESIPAETRTHIEQPLTGDFDAMVKRRLIRAGVVFN